MTHHNEQEAIGGYEADTIMGDELLSDVEIGGASQVVSSGDVRVVAAALSSDNESGASQTSPTQLNEAVKLFLAGVNPEICPTIHSIIAQQAAIIEQQREEIERLTMEANAGRQAEAEANAECKQQRAVLVQAREGLASCVILNNTEQVFDEDAVAAALTAIDKALGV